MKIRRTSVEQRKTIVNKRARQRSCSWTTWALAIEKLINADMLT
jgi:hypothetical protein